MHFAKKTNGKSKNAVSDILWHIQHQNIIIATNYYITTLPVVTSVWHDLQIIPDPHSKWHNEVCLQRFMKQGFLVAQTQAALFSQGVHYIAD